MPLFISNNYMELLPARRVKIMQSEKVANSKQQIGVNSGYFFWLILL